MSVEEKSGNLSVRCPGCGSPSFVLFNAKKLGFRFEVLSTTPDTCSCGYPLSIIVEGMIQE